MLGIVSFLSKMKTQLILLFDNWCEKEKTEELTWRSRWARRWRWRRWGRRWGWWRRRRRGRRWGWSMDNYWLGRRVNNNRMGRRVEVHRGVTYWWVMHERWMVYERRTVHNGRSHWSNPLRWTEERWIARVVRDNVGRPV